MTPPPLRGVGVLILRQDKLLLGRRRGSHGAATWAPPGGHIEEGERPEETAKREVFEETGLQIEGARPGPVTEDRFPEGKHYITTFVIADSPSGAPQNLEPHKCDGWEWFSWDSLPTPLFLPLQSLHQTGFRPS